MNYLQEYQQFSGNADSQRALISIHKILGRVWNGSIFSIRKLKKGSDFIGLLLEGLQCRVQSFLQVGFAFDGLFSHLAVLDLVPDLLVGIEFWRMGRKEEHPQLGPMGQNELAHGRRPMKRRLIRDENQGSGSPP